MLECLDRTRDDGGMSNMVTAKRIPETPPTSSKGPLLPHSSGDVLRIACSERSAWRQRASPPPDVHRQRFYSAGSIFGLAL